MIDAGEPTLGALRALREVARSGSIASAAAALGVTQQAASAQLRGLERRVGMPLLVRTPAGSAPTEAGTLVIGWSEEVLAAAARLDAGIRTLASGSTARLAIAASQTIAESLLPGWLVALRAAEESDAIQPTAIDLTVRNSRRVIELVRSGTHELGFVETPRLPTDLTAVPLRDDELVVVVAPAHPWASRRRPLGLEELAATPLVMREAGSGTRDALTERLAAHTPPLHAEPAAELGTSAAVRSAIAGNVAPGALSRLAVRDDLVLGRLVTVVVEGPALTRTLTAIWRPRSGRLTGGAQRLLTIARGPSPRHRDAVGRPSA